MCVCARARALRACMLAITKKGLSMVLSMVTSGVCMWKCRMERVLECSHDWAIASCHLARKNVLAESKSLNHDVVQ